MTKRVKLGTLVTGVNYRHPGILVKTVTTLDVLSGGRAYLGIGAAWNEQESRGLGVPFPPLKERFERLEEALQIAHQMWTDDRAPYSGTALPAGRSAQSARSRWRKPHPPIMIGGGGEQKTCGWWRSTPMPATCSRAWAIDVLRKKLDVLRGPL